MNKIAVFLLSLYLLLPLSIGWLATFSESPMTTVLRASVVADILVLILSAVLNAASAIKYLVTADEPKLRRASKIFKFGTIPFFIANFVWLLLVAFVFVAASRGLGIFFVPVLIGLTYVVFAFTIPYSVCYILLLRRQGKIDTGSMLTHIFFQFCFVLDVVGMLVLLNTTREQRK